MPIHESQNTFWLTTSPQTNYATERDDMFAKRRILTTDLSPFDTQSQYADNAGEAHGSDVASDQWRETKVANKSFPQRVNFQDIGWWLHSALGVIETTGDAGVGYTHAFAPLNPTTSRQLPARTFGQKLGALGIKIFPSGVINQLTITWRKGAGMLEVTAEVRGSGKQILSGYTEPALEADRQYAYNQQIVLFAIDDGTDTQSYLCELEEWTLTINNNLDDAGSYRGCSPFVTAGNPKSGIIRSEHLFGRREIMLSFTARAETTDVLDDISERGENLEDLTIQMTGIEIPDSDPAADFDFQFSFANGRITDSSDILADGFNAIRGEAKLLSSGGGVLPFSAQLINDVSSYTS